MQSLKNQNTTRFHSFTVETLDAPLHVVDGKPVYRFFSGDPRYAVDYRLTTALLGKFGQFIQGRHLFGSMAEVESFRKTGPSPFVEGGRA